MVHNERPAGKVGDNLDHYVPLAADEQLVFFFDSTLMSSGKKGVVGTDKRLVAFSKGSRTDYPLSQVDQVVMEVEDEIAALIVECAGELTNIAPLTSDADDVAEMLALISPHVLTSSTKKHALAELPTGDPLKQFQHYCPLEQDEEVAFFFDSTFMSNGKKGLVGTNRRIISYSKDTKQSWRLSDLQHMVFAFEDDTATICVVTAAGESIDITPVTSGKADLVQMRTLISPHLECEGESGEGGAVQEIEYTYVTRPATERVAFAVVSSLFVGFLALVLSDASEAPLMALVGTGGTAFMIWGTYWIAQMFGLWEEPIFTYRFREDDIPDWYHQAFSVTRFAFEFVLFIGLAIVVTITVAIAKLVMNFGD